MTDKIIELTSEIAASYLGANAVSMDELPSLIKSIHAALATVGQTPVELEIDAKPTAAQIRKSITPDALISFIDGKPYKTLKRHLTTNGETIASYKAILELLQSLRGIRLGLGPAALLVHDSLKSTRVLQQRHDEVVPVCRTVWRLG